MSITTTNSRLKDLEYSMKTNFDNMKTDIETVRNVIARTEEKLASLGNGIDQAEVGLPSFYPHPCIA
jgi:hypothetical protein